MISSNKPKNPHAQALGSLGGKSTSEAKKVAARENGKKGGRPKIDPSKGVCQFHNPKSKLYVDKSPTTPHSM